MMECQADIAEHNENPDYSSEYDDSLPIVDYEIPYEEFFSNFMLNNRPCLFKKFISDQWECRRLWVNGCSPNWSCLRETFGAAEVPVANCDEREYNAQKKSTFSLIKYLDYIQDYKEQGYSSNFPNLYLKDWHLTRDYPNAAFYRVPKYFSSDWLNEYYTARADLCDDYRFVYLGPKGSWTPFHADVFSSFSWSVNIVGRKRWVLFPPGEEAPYRDRFGNLAYDIFSADIQKGKEFPLRDKPCKYYDIVQETGEGIFVPSGWHHQVWNLEDTISINHNWINGCNIKHVWMALKSCLSSVQQEVSDCRDMDGWHSHCQLMLRSTHGMNYEEFFDLLKCVAVPRIMQLEGHSTVNMYGGWELGQNHVIWDLKHILATLDLLLNDENLTNLPWVSLKKPSKLHERINILLETIPSAK